MRKLFYYFSIIIICSMIWVILNEELSVVNYILGGVFGFISIVITENLLLLNKFSNLYQINLLVLIKYLFNLIINIYASGFTTIIKIVTGKINPGIVEIKTEITNDLYICLLANAITLTPGTVTLEKKGQNLKVLWLDCTTKDSIKAGKIIMGSFEKIFIN